MLSLPKLYAAVTFLLKLFSSYDTTNPSTCLKTSETMEDFAKCMDTFTVPHDFYDAESYDAAQPDVSQRFAWMTAVRSMIEVDGDCSDIPIPIALRDHYKISPFQSFCVLHETEAPFGVYRKGWGYMVAPARRTSVKARVHISVPHPKTDLGTPEQAAAIFDATKANSLLVAGRQRTSFLQPSRCIFPSNMGGQIYWMTDPAHNDLEPFFDAIFAIESWNVDFSSELGLPGAYIQLHGKGSSTCPTDQIFLSSGLTRTAISLEWYTDSTDRPVKRLQRALRNAFPQFNVSMPTDSTCGLLASKNVAGRYLNGVTRSEVCTSQALPRMVSGKFIHIEQSAASRHPRQYESWSRAIGQVFEDPIE